MKMAVWVLVLPGLLIAASGCEDLHHHHHGARSDAHGQSVEGHRTYSFGELVSVEKMPFDRALAATQSALAELEFFITSRDSDKISGTFIARGAGDRKVTVHLDKVSEDLTEISIRVGFPGDESASMLILDKIVKSRE